MFRLITIISVALTVGVVMMMGKKLAVPAGVVQKKGRYPLLEGLVALAMWVSLIVLVCTGFCGASLLGHSLKGFMTLIHVSFGTLFAISIAVLAVFRGEAYCFGAGETSGRFSIAQKVCFWIIALCGLVLILSILTSMLRLFGTDGQLLSAWVHRFSALIALLAAIVYAGAARARG